MRSTQPRRSQAAKLLEARFALDDFYTQLQQLKKMGPLGDLLKMIPGMGRLAKQLPEGPGAERELRRVVVIISSMTKGERADPSIINGSRRKRIARGWGTAAQSVNQLLRRQFVSLGEQMRQLRPMLQGGRLPRTRM